MNDIIASRIFSKRDENFDFIRSILVISMIFTHAFNFFYRPDYNRNLSFFVTIGFVLISGFSLGAKNSERIPASPIKYLKIFLHRFLKIFLIFAVLNCLVLVAEPSRMKNFFNQSLIEIFIVVFTGDKNLIFAFDILPAIALTTLLSYLTIITIDKSTRISIITSFLSLFSILLIEQFFGDKLITIKLSLVGIFGCSIGVAISNINLRNALKFIKQYMIGMTLLIILYFILMYFSLWPKGPKLLFRHIIPTLVLLVYVYLISNVYNLNNRLWFIIVNKTIGSYLLFSYIFHIIIIRILGFSYESQLSFLSTLGFGFILTLITIIVCLILDFLRNHNGFFSKAYSALFGV